MAGEWTNCELGEICEFRAGSVFPPAAQGQLSGQYPFVKVSDMNLPANAVRIQGANNWVSVNDLRTLRAKPLPLGTVVFAKIGEALRQNRLRQVARETIVDNNMMGAVPRDDRIDPQFFYYALSQFDFSDIAQGTALPYLTISSLSALRLEIPPLSEQLVIARILGSLDDKIELNRRMNETLEAMAQALFKSWFVDFDPVRTKIEGRDPVLPKSIADLFPDAFDDEELGKIPKGWQVMSLPEMIEVNPSRPLRKAAFAPYLDMANMPTRGHVPDEVIARAFGSGMRFVNGDTLMARITPCLENGKTAYVDFLESGQVGWGSTEYIVLRPKPPLPEEFAYCLARSDEFREFAIQSMTGSSGRQRVPAESLSHYLMPMPSPNVADRFGRLVRPLFVRASAASQESRTLAALRDALLPKLITGELRVKNMNSMELTAA